MCIDFFFREGRKNINAQVGVLCIDFLVLGT